MISGSPPSQPIWPYLAMPAAVLIVFCILHFDVRSLGKRPATAAPAATLAQDAPLPAE